MKKILPLFICLFIVVICDAQTDSTEIKLQQYKDLFVKGLITSTEYEQLKGKLLNIQTFPSSQSVENVKSQTTTVLKKETSKVTLDSIERKMRANYHGSVGVGITGMVIGSGFIIGTAIYGLTNTSPRANAIIPLAIFGGLGITLGAVSLGTGIAKWNKYQMTKGEALFLFRSNQISFAYNF